MKKIKVLSIFGTRPEAIKMAPVIKKLKDHPQTESFVCVTGQHREMLSQVLDLFHIVPDINLDIMKEKQTISYITTAALEGLDQAIGKIKPDIVLVHGDTTTTFAGALAAFYHQIPVGHVEAGLRTYNKYSPYPEEMNRKLTGALTDFHFAPTELSKENLLKEGVKEESIFVTGNTVIDAVKMNIEEQYRYEDDALNQLDLSKKIVLLTSHRRENLGEKMRDYFKGIRAALEKYPELFMVYPVHKNPLVMDAAKEAFGDVKNIKLIEPIGVKDCHNLMNHCYFVLTDSGGIQEEASALSKPVLVLRDTTERTEALKEGGVKLAGTTYRSVLDGISMLMEDPVLYDTMKRAKNPYGDGTASEKIVQIITEHFKEKS